RLFVFHPAKIEFIMPSRPDKKAPASKRPGSAGLSRAGSSSRAATGKEKVAGIDAMFAMGGLKRNRRGAAVSAVRAARFDRAGQEELARAAPVSRIAANGAAWLPIPDWDFPWLWSGFST